MIDTAIILCGGFGTRLKSVVSDIPKPMAPINGRPFLEYMLDYFNANGIKNVILATSYKATIIKDHFSYNYKNITISYTEEKEALGTGGGIKLALQHIQKLDDKITSCFVANGDSFIQADLGRMSNFHFNHFSPMSIALKEMNNFDRYGSVLFNDNLSIYSFQEKKAMEKGFINTGLYILDLALLNEFPLEEKFSFEKFLEEKTEQITPKAFLTDGYFIDIGIPEDFATAQETFKQIDFNRS